MVVHEERVKAVLRILPSTLARTALGTCTRVDYTPRNYQAIPALIPCAG